MYFQFYSWRHVFVHGANGPESSTTLCLKRFARWRYQLDVNSVWSSFMGEVSYLPLTCFTSRVWLTDITTTFAICRRSPSRTWMRCSMKSRWYVAKCFPSIWNVFYFRGKYAHFNVFYFQFKHREQLWRVTLHWFTRLRTYRLQLRVGHILLQ